MTKEMKNRQKRIDELVQRGKEGDAAALEKLASTYRPLLLSLVKKTTWSSTDWEDTLQEAHLALIQAVHSYDPEKGVYFPVYLKSQVFYHLMARVRREKVPALSLDTPMGDPEEGGTLADTLEDDTPPALSTLIEAEEYAELHRRLETLPKRQRQIITDRYFRGLSPGEIASRLGLARKTVENLHSRAIKNLRRRF